MFSLRLISEIFSPRRELSRHSRICKARSTEEAFWTLGISLSSILDLRRFPAQVNRPDVQDRERKPDLQLDPTGGAFVIFGYYRRRECLPSSTMFRSSISPRPASVTTRLLFTWTALGDIRWFR